MAFKTVLLIFIGIILINKILDKLINLSEKIKNEKKEIFNINILKDFERLIIEYLKYKGYNNLVEGAFGEITVYGEEGAILVKYKKINKVEEYINKEEIISFIADMNIKGLKKGIFLTNGVVNANIKKIIEDNFHSNIDLEIIDGINFIIELKKLKLKEEKNFSMQKGMI